ncbi:MAG: dynamin family protein [Kiritimatiellae bacterium]|nr:dynamin family protein [Kiritimatiellia bacterium]
MNALDCFYKKVAELHGQVATSDKEVERIIALFESEMDNLCKSFSLAEKKLQKNCGSIAAVKFMGALSKRIAVSLDMWKNKQKESVDSQRLRSVADDSLLIIVYGKVKAGKSTLGNYIANSAPKKSTPHFFTFDHGGSEVSTPKLAEFSGDSFETKTTECTSTIQGFKIQGMTWIDTPGLASMTGANGALARKYIEAADLIIYPMSSDSPGRHTDTDELRELAKAGEHFCVVITKSDFTDEDELDGKLVRTLRNKTKEDRLKQEEWVQTEILKKLKKVSIDHNTQAEEYLCGKILSISIMTAREYPEDSEQWINSNIPALYTMFNDVLNKDAVRLRGQKALFKVSSFLRECILNQKNPDSLVSHFAELQGELNDLKAKAAELTGQCNTLASACMNDVNLEVQKIVLSAKKNGWAGKKIGEEILEVVRKKVIAEAEPAARKILDNFAEKLEAEFPVPELNPTKLDIKDKIKTITVSNERVAKAGGAGAGAIVGGALGLFIPVPGLGPMLGSILGSFVGGYAGRKIGDGFSSSTEKRVTVGDNSQDVEDQALQFAERAVNVTMEAVLNGFNTKVVHPVAQEVTAMSKNMNKTIKIMNKELQR